MSAEDSIPRVLVADDSDLNRRVLEKMLRRLGAEPTMVENGEQCVACAVDGAFDLVLMDWRMEGMDGIAAAQEIRSRGVRGRSGGHLTIVAVTANTHAVDRERCRLAGMDGFVAKPFGVEDIRQVLARCRGGAE